MIELKSVDEKGSSLSVRFFGDGILILLHDGECEGFTQTEALRTKSTKVEYLVVQCTWW